MVMEVVVEDIGDGSMQCTIHPYKNSMPAGGICAFCLQEKLGKLVSSSFPVAIFPSASLPSSPSVRSEFGSNITTTTSASSKTATTNENNNSSTKPSRLPFLPAESTKKKKKKKKGGVISVSDSASIVFKRSKSNTTPRHAKFVDDEEGEVYGHHRRGFLSFLYPTTTATSSSAKQSATAKKKERNYHKDVGIASSSSSSKREEITVVAEEEKDIHNRKVSRSRSVGCGSRSFSGDFFERISTGLGDCTVLRRAESQRDQAKPKHSNNNGQDCIKERIKCGGIFGGFAVITANEDDKNLAHGRSKSTWGWALMASPMRAFSAKPSTTTGTKQAQNNKNLTPNLAAIPSLLAVRT